MKLTFERDVLLPAVQSVMGAIDRKVSMPVLSHVHWRATGSEVFITGTDLQTTLIAKAPLVSEPFETCIPSRKLLDVLRAFPEGSMVGMQIDEAKLTLKCGKSRFTFALLDGKDYPTFPTSESENSVTVNQAELKSMIAGAAFSIAEQDVRYYLNGLLFEMKGNDFYVVGTDGHRLAVQHITLANDVDERQIIMPSKSIVEMKRMLNEGECTLELNSNHVKMELANLTFISKLIDGKFPEWRRVVPSKSDIKVPMNRLDLLNALNRVSLVLDKSNSGVSFELSEGCFKLAAKCNDEDAEEQLEVEYLGNEIRIGLNFHYMKDVLNAMTGETILFQMTDAQSSIKIEGVDSDEGQFVIMPMRL